MYTVTESDREQRQSEVLQKSQLKWDVIYKSQLQRFFAGNHCSAGQLSVGINGTLPIRWYVI